MYKRVFKRVMDVFLAFLGIIFVSPVIIIISLLLFVTLKTSPFFVQIRPGKDKKPYKILKLKTMNDSCDETGKLLPDEERLTTIGKAVRKFSLDEIPQLINILKGEMSFVGPRPLLLEYLALYSCEQARRHEVRPGLTGWAQVNGRNALSWEEKFNLDVWYVDNISLKLDLKILFLTIVKVLKQEGINSHNAATMKKFTGSKCLN